MKKIVFVCVTALAVANAMAQGRSEVDISKECEEKIPVRYRMSVRHEIRSEAHRQANEEVEKKFRIVPDGQGWTNNCGKSFFLGNSFICEYTEDGHLVKSGNKEDFEELRWRDAREEEIQETLWKDQSVVDAAVSNIVARAQQRQSRGRRWDTRKAEHPASNQPNTGTLEELIPMEEAMALAQAGKGKGYFQLALRYANGQELPYNPQKAHKMLCKAATANYANAILVEGLCDESGLKAEVRERSRNVVLNEDSSTETALRRYCGDHACFNNGKWNSGWRRLENNNRQLSGRRRNLSDRRRNRNVPKSPEFDSLTNNVAVACVMGKYEKAKALGALAATNQIAALNKRLANFRVGLVAYNTKKEMNEKKAAQQGTEQKMKQKMEKEESDKRQVNNRKVHTLLGAKELAWYRVAFKEMFGYEMGEMITQEADDKTEKDYHWKEWRVRKLRTPYRNFTLMRLRCVDDRLCEVEIELKPENKSISDSLYHEARAIMEDLAQRYCIESRKWDHQSRWREEEDWRAEEYGWKFMVMVNRGTITVQVCDYDLVVELESQASIQKREK